ncbi:MAG: hypothetical protein HY540_00390 [Deltaproteobacteria bacterium]|nr:hypothetical protein [Deltaproteobacteria bacterium]
MNGFWTRWMMIVSLVIAVGGVVAAHFNGIESSKTYTDVMYGKIDEKVDRIFEKLKDVESDVAVIKASVERKK